MTLGNHWIPLVMLIIAISLISTPVAARQAQLRAEQAPYYVDVPIRLQVITDGFEETPQPKVTVDAPRQGRLDLIGVNPNVSTSIQIINGQMNQSRRVQFIFEYRFTAKSTGQHTLGPFHVTQNGKQANTGTLILNVGAIPASNQQQLRLILPKSPLIVGQRAKIQLEWWLPDTLRGKLFNPLLSVPFFSQPDTFRFHDIPNPAADINLTVDTRSGPIKLPATTRRVSKDNQSFLVHTFTRQLVPLKAGEFELAPARLVVDEAIRWRRTLFGERIPTHAQKRRVQDRPHTLTVRELPAAGRPESFTGTVGQGYRLDVSADRSVVQVGDPIRLTLTLQGDAAVETATLPPLSADGGLSLQDFRMTQEKSTGIYTGDTKQFEVTVRALHEGVTEIPPLAFSWYDPEQQQYRMTHSQPIALSVRPAQLVSASDVVSATPPESHNAQNAQKPKSERSTDDLSLSPGTSGIKTQQRPAFSLSGADLAINTDIDTLLQPGSSPTSRVILQVSLYGLGILAIILAVVARRHAMADPDQRARAKTLCTLRDQVANASKIIEVSDALRRMVATAGIRSPAELDAFLAECDAHAYAPGGVSSSPDEPMRSKALALAKQMLTLQVEGNR